MGQKVGKSKIISSFLITTYISNDVFGDYQGLKGFSGPIGQIGERGLTVSICSLHLTVIGKEIMQFSEVYLFLILQVLSFCKTHL